MRVSVSAGQLSDIWIINTSLVLSDRMLNTRVVIRTVACSSKSCCGCFGFSSLATVPRCLFLVPWVQLNWDKTVCSCSWRLEKLEKEIPRIRPLCVDQQSPNHLLFGRSSMHKIDGCAVQVAYLVRHSWSVNSKRSRLKCWLVKPFRKSNAL